jgi:hypothetical protein
MRRNIAPLLVLFFLTASLIMQAKPASATTTVENSWTAQASMQVARGALGVAVANDKIYAIGGTAGATQSTVRTNEEYNPTTNTWTYKTPIPTPRSYFAIATYENKIYCIGGNTYTLDPVEYILTGANEVYDPRTDTWETKAPLPNPKEAITANVIDNKIYVVGDESDELWAYDPATDQWAQKAPMPSTPTLIRGEWSCSSAVINNKLHVSWGAHQVYDPLTNTWSSASSSATAYFGSAGATTGVDTPSRFYVFGVDYEFWYLSYPNSVSLCYDPKTGNWSTFGLMGGYTLFIGNNIDSSGVNERYTPLGYGLAPVVSIVSPENEAYDDVDILLSVEVDKISETKYSLDGYENVTFTGDIILSNLEVGEHNIIVYATDIAGHVGVSEIIYFSVESFPTTLVGVSVATVAVIAVGLLVYFKKHKQ